MTLETIAIGLVWLAWGLKLLWRVSPIDEPRELRTTRLLGGLLALLSPAVWWRLVTLER